MELKPGDTIVEIGPGHGELTEELLGFSCELLEKNGSPPIKVIAIEKDPKLANDLRSRIYDLGIKDIEILNGDALSILKSKFINLKSEYKIVGNIPYYITGKLLRILSELSTKPELCVFTIQKEVAERICAAPPRMNRLAAIVQFWADPQLIGLIPRKDFDPQPEVDSAIVKLSVKCHVSGVREQLYYKTVKILFAQPRKTILNNMCQVSSIRCQDRSRKTTGKPESKESIAETLIKMGVDPKSRPQNLSVEDIVRIARAMAS